jgi:lipid II:glycine glycyltransferase (peptidoglycan interpeptide bridge formation enzyme)
MLEILDEKEFNEFSKNNDKSIFFESSYWGELKKSTGWNYYLVGYKKEKLLGATILLYKKIPIFNRYIFYSPRGFLIDYNDLDLVKTFTEEIKKFVKNKKGIFFKINPLVIYQERDINGDIVENGYNNKELVEYLKKLGYIHTGFSTTYGKDLEPRWISVLDLKNKTIDDIKSNYRSTTRWDINHSYKHGLELVEIDESRLDEFKKLMEHTGLRRGFIDRPLSYYKKMYEEFNKSNNIKVMLVELNLEKSKMAQIETKDKASKKLEQELQKEKRKENLVKELQKQIEAATRKEKEIEQLQKEHGEKIVVAGGLFMTFGKQVVSLFGASYKEFMKYKGQYFLNNEMIEFAINNGYEKYNFYGITGEFNEDSPMYGLFDFKRGFGANVEELIGEFTFITDKLYYHIYNMMFWFYRKLKGVLK